MMPSLFVREAFFAVVIEKTQLVSMLNTHNYECRNMNESSISFSPIQGSESPLEMGDKNVKSWEEEKKTVTIRYGTAVVQICSVIAFSRPKQDQGGQNSSIDGGVDSQDPPIEEGFFTVVSC